MALYSRKLVVVMAVLLIAGGCKQREQPVPTVSETATPAAMPGAAATTSAAAAGELAENIYDAAKAGDWSTSTAKLDTLRAAVGTSAPAPERAQLDSLSKAVSAHDRTGALEASNALTRDFARATAEASSTPVEIVMLDYYGRELEIGAARGNAGMGQLRSAATDIRRAWNAVRPKVIERNGKAEAEAFDKEVTRVEAARTPAEYGATATPILDEVDKLEAVFKR